MGSERFFSQKEKKKGVFWKARMLEEGTFKGGDTQWESKTYIQEIRDVFE
jgi:hypothetical protein